VPLKVAGFLPLNGWRLEVGEGNATLRTPALAAESCWRRSSRSG